jgi:hypothetical protein
MLTTAVRLTLTLLLLCTSGTHAQDKRSIRVLAFPKQMRPEPVELVIGKNKTIQIDTPGNELSQPYEIPPLESIVVGETVTDEEGKPNFVVLGRAKALASPKQIVLLLRKGRENRDGFVVLPLNGDLKNFDGGSYLFINASKLNVGGIIGSSKFALKPGQRRLLTPEADHEGGVCQVSLSYERDDTWKVFHDTRWPTNKRYRSLIFFHQDPKTGRLGVAPIVDMLLN